MNYGEISKETIHLLYQSRASLNNSPLNPTIRLLAELRVSQINGCTYCCRLHMEEARKLGLEDSKLQQLSSWRTSLSFASVEKLVLEWTELVTHLDQSSSEIKEQLSKIYSEREIVDLTACIAIMNALNRIVISLRG